MRIRHTLLSATRALGKRTYVPSIIAFVVVFAFAIYAEKQNDTIAIQKQRAIAGSETSRLRAEVEGYVNAELQLIQGMVASISGNLDITQEEYSALGELVTGGHEEFINIAASPGLVVSLVYPYEKNRSVLGFDLNTSETQRAAAFRVRDEGKMLLAGPVELVQGGTGFLGRFPVFDQRSGVKRFWGIVSAVIDADKLYAEAGLLNDDLSLDIALRGTDSTGADGPLFFGNPEVLEDNPILLDIKLPNGSWQLAARPKEGWVTGAANPWGNRLFFLAALVFILLPIVSVARLSDSRSKIIEALRSREEELERLSLVAKHASDSIVLSDPNGEIIWANDGFTRMTGYTLEEAQGNSVGKLLNSPDTDPYTIQSIRHHQEAGQRFHTEILNRTKFGKDIWVDTNLFPVKDETGNVVMSIGIEREITETKKYEAELADAKRAAEQADKAKTEFLANMSHEIRTPMNAIIGMSELLSESDLNDEDTQGVETIRDSGHALLKIINDILDLSRLEAGKFDLSEVDFDLKRCIDGVVNLLRHKAEKKGIEFTVEYATDLPSEVRADDGRLRQILMNLIGNAIKFTSEGSVHVNVQCDHNIPNGIQVKVSDTGIGISKEQAKHIFDRFSQADAATTRAFGGTGLGLTISTMLARHMGGDITLCSEYHDGACFSVSIATSPVQSKAPIVDEALDFVPANLEGARILLAEDNKTNRLLIRKFLAEFDLELIEVENGLGAVEHCRRHAPDVVLMDMSMPELDGVTATRIIRSLSINQPPIIALTANAFESDKQTCLDAGMDFFLSKPINKTHLLQALSTHLEHRLAS
ncbi:response regulator [Shimia sp. R11_0]|uniref:ATP-binding protein n=1 Tax=Shimia sp. R11_0 TaxID=2821096 RepID=UPI001ADC32CD|nr:ATP-binding protein [Shimia sp. R11_0]MBO9477734.1 response regulator [Shimia sp. R11_0]